jgi:signal peptidase I
VESVLVRARDRAAAHTAFEAAQRGANLDRWRWRRRAQWASAVAGVVVAVAGLRAAAVSLVTVDASGPSAAMAPTLSDPDLVVVNRFAYRLSEVRRGEVVAVRSGNDLVLVRVVALAGEVVSVTGGVVVVDGRRLVEPYLVDGRPFDAGPVTVPAGSVWVLPDGASTAPGDVGSGSGADGAAGGVSGVVALADVAGRAELVVWPASRWSNM